MLSSKSMPHGVYSAESCQNLTGCEYMSGRQSSRGHAVNSSWQMGAGELGVLVGSSEVQKRNLVKNVSSHLLRILTVAMRTVSQVLLLVLSPLESKESKGVMLRLQHPMYRALSCLLPSHIFSLLPFCLLILRNPHPESPPLRSLPELPV